MEQDKNKIKEPYSPENTPSPPQIIDPSRNEEGHPVRRTKETEKKGKATARKKVKQKNKTTK